MQKEPLQKTNSPAILDEQESLKAAQEFSKALEESTKSGE